MEVDKWLSDCGLDLKSEKTKFTLLIDSKRVERVDIKRSKVEY